MRSLVEQRTPLYSQADLRITQREGDTPEDITKRIIEGIPPILK
jgi:shikimate kinase